MRRNERKGRHGEPGIEKGNEEGRRGWVLGLKGGGGGGGGGEEGKECESFD